MNVFKLLLLGPFALLFNSDGKEKSERKALKEIAKQNDQAELMEIARITQYSSVRSAAIEKITEPALIAELAKSWRFTSDLWNLTDEFLELFAVNHVSIGTSLDGPQELCDSTRGEGYFAKTWASVCKAKDAGCFSGAIATIARPTLPHTREIAKFFRDNGVSFMLHGALGAMHDPEKGLALAASDYTDMVNDLYSWYISNRTFLKIDTLEHFVRGIVTGQPTVCTMRDCFGMFLAISPTGEITSCQRLAGKKEFSLGNIFDKPTLAAVYGSPTANKQLEREKRVFERCASCEFYPICKGGCFYNAVASGDGVLDPWCEPYKDIYTFVWDKVMEEMQSPANVEVGLLVRPGRMNICFCVKARSSLLPALFIRCRSPIMPGGFWLSTNWAGQTIRRPQPKTCTNRRYAEIRPRPKNC